MRISDWSSDVCSSDLGRAQEAVAVGQDFQPAVGLHALSGAGEHLEQGEDHVLLARAGDGVGDAQLFGDVKQLVRRHALEVAQRVLREALGDVGRRQALALVVAVDVARHAVVAAAAVAVAVAAVAEALAAVVVLAAARSEEHTSELQSLMRISYAVFCLKKKKTKQLT